MPAKARTRMPNPVRALLVLLLVVVATAGVVLGLGRTTPEPGLKLAGGGTVSLTAVTGNHRTPTAAQLDEPVAVMNERAYALGASEIQPPGNVIVIRIHRQGRVATLVQTRHDDRLRTGLEAGGVGMTLMVVYCLLWTSASRRPER